MAGSGERRMLFDIRGRRKNVLRVVYAVLALLMAGSLFVAVGPFNLAELIGNGNTSSAAEVFDEQVERIEGRLAKSPEDEGLLLALTRARINAGNSRTDEDPSTGARVITPEASEDFAAAQETWQRYLKAAGDEPSPTAAQLVAGTYYSLAESSSTIDEIESNIEQAATAQRVAAEARPNVGSLTTLAIYEFFAGNFAAGEQAGKQAEGLAPSQTAAKQIEKQLAVYRKRANEWAEQKAKFAKLEQKQSKEALQNPLGGFSGASSGVAP